MQSSRTGAFAWAAVQMAPALLVASFFGGLLIFPADAVTTNWTLNSGFGFFNAAVLWDNGVPDAGDTAVFRRGNLSSYTVLLRENPADLPIHPTINRLIIGGNTVTFGGHSSSTMAVEQIRLSRFGGDMIIGQTSTDVAVLTSNLASLSVDNAILGSAAGSSGTLNLTQNNDKFNVVATDATYDLVVGSSGAGAINVSGGADVTVADDTVLGLNGTGAGTVSISGAGSTWTNAGDLVVGLAGTGTLDITAGGVVSNGNAYVGLQLGSTGVVTVNGAGSTWTNSGFIGIGEIGSGELNVRMGGRVSSTHATVGQGGSGTAVVAGAGSMWSNTSFLEVGNGGTGAMTIEHGGVVTNTNGFIGRGLGSDGTVMVRGANSTWTNNGNLAVGHHGTGSLTIEAGGKVTVSGFTSINSLSQVAVSSGTFDGTGDLTIIGGSLTADAGAVIDITQAFLRNGATIAVQNESEFTQTAGALFMESGTVMRVNSGAIYNTDFTIVGNTPGPAAELLVDGTNTLVRSMSCCIDVGYGGTGIMTVTGGARIETPTGAVGSFAFGSAPSIGTLTLDGTDASGNPSSWVIGAMNVGLHATSHGTIQILNGAQFRATSPSYGLAVGNPGAGTVVVEGTDATGNPSLLDAARLSIGTGGYGNGTGEVTASSGGRIEAGTIGLAPTGGTATLTITDANSALVQSGASTITVGHATDGSAVINVRNNATLTTGTGAINIYATGEINLESGALFDARGPINMNGGQFNFRGGTLHVDDFNGTLVNQGGTLAPGHSIGATDISNNYTQLAAATLEIEIAGVLLGDWDTLTVAGNALLDGTIEVKLLDGFQPVIGNSFTILTTTFGNVGGQFDTEILPTIDGLTFDVVYNPQSVVLQVIEATTLPGDYNNDGTVDAADYVVWRKNPDGFGGSAGYDTWRTNFGRTAGGAAAVAQAQYRTTIPEPPSLFLGLVSAAVLAEFTRRRTWQQQEKRIGPLLRPGF